MDSKCSYPNCFKIASWECECPDKPKYCDLHGYNHFANGQCQRQCIKKRNALKLKIGQNALKKVEVECLKLAQDMISQVNIHLIGSLKYLKAKKLALNDFIHQNMEVQANTILNWANATNLTDQNKSQFNFIIKRLFDLDNFSQHFIDIAKLEADSNLKKIELEQAYIKISQIEKELSAYKNKKVGCEAIELNKENKNIMKINEFISDYNLVAFPNKGIQQKQISLVQNDFLNFKKDIIDKNFDVKKIYFTNDNRLIFICSP